MSHIQPLSRREANKAQNREKILSAGREVFSTKGLDACSIRDVVRESGLSPGSFYNYFGTKEGIFAALIEELLGKVERAIAEIKSQNISVKDFFERGFAVYIDLLVSEPWILQLIGRNMQTSRTAFRESGAYRGVQKTIRDFIEAGIANGTIRPVDPQMMTSSITMLAIEVSFSASQAGTLDRQATAGFLADLFVNTMRPG